MVFSLLIQDGSVLLIKFLADIFKTQRDQQHLAGLLIHLYEAFAWRFFEVLPHGGLHQGNKPAMVREEI
jgi:hypothetical protein